MRELFEIKLRFCFRTCFAERLGFFLVRKLREFRKQHRNQESELMLQFAFQEHLSELIRYVQSRSIESHVVGGAVPNFLEIVNEEIVTFSGEEEKVTN